MQQALPQSQQERTLKPRQPLNLNMRIAQTHEIATQFVGIQLSGANLLALAVSAASVVAGTTSIAIQHFPSSWPLWIAAGSIGIGLAFLIEGLTLGALIRIRLATTQSRQIEAQLDRQRDDEIAPIERPTPQGQNDPKGYKQALAMYETTIKAIEREYRRKKRNATRQARGNQRSSLPIALLGALASAYAGGLFYHTILATIGMWESIGLSALFALVVTGTFVSSELFKDIQQEAIREGFEGGALTQTAIQQETKRLALIGIYDRSLNYIESAEARQIIEAGFKGVISDTLQALREPIQGGEPSRGSAYDEPSRHSDEFQGVHPQQVQDQINDLLHQMRGVLQGVQQVVQTEMHQEVQAIRGEVQQAMLHLPQQLQEQVHYQLHQELEQRVHPLFNQLTQTVERQYTRGRAEKSQQIHPRTTKPLRGVHSTQERPQGESSQGAIHQRTTPRQEGTSKGVIHPQQGAGIRVQEYVRAQLAQGHRPTLKELMTTCQCSKKTAITNRRAILGDEDDQAQEQQTA